MDTWIAIELHSGDRMKILGTVPDEGRIGEWFAGAASLGDLPSPKWTDELRLTQQPAGTVLHTNRLGWVEVEPKPLIQVVQ